MAREPAPLISDLRAALRAVADPKRAPAMQAYMKSEMPFLGIPAALRVKTCKRVFAAHPLPSFTVWRRAVLTLFREAEVREERYAAIELTGQRAARDFQTLDALPLYEELITTGAWWDYVDELAANRIGPLLRAFRSPMRRAMLEWSRSPDLWKRRSAIISQLRFKRDTDLALLYECIEPSLGSREFFLCKAIGWALRQYAWTDPREVARYVRVNRSRLSPLSIREALKNVSAAGRA